VVRGDGLDDPLGLAVLLGQLDAELGVRALDVAVDGLADVVEQAGPQGDVVSRPISRAIMAASMATSLVCWRTFCP